MFNFVTGTLFHKPLMGEHPATEDLINELLVLFIDDMALSRDALTHLGIIRLSPVCLSGNICSCLFLKC